MIILPRRLRFLSRPAPVAAVAPVTDGDHGSARDRRAVRVTRLPPVARRSCRPRRVSRVCVRPPGRPGARPRSSGPFSGVSRRGQSPCQGSSRGAARRRTRSRCRCRSGPAPALPLALPQPPTQLPVAVPPAPRNTNYNVIGAAAAAGAGVPQSRNCQEMPKSKRSAESLDNGTYLTSGDDDHLDT